MISDWVNDEVLTVCFDFNGLPGYLAVERTKVIIDELGIQVDWLPLTTNLNSFSSKQPEENADDPLAEYKARRRRAKERYARRELERNCEMLGLTVEQGRRTFDSTAAAKGLLWARKCQADALGFIRAVFERGYREGASVDDPSAITDALDSCGISIDGFGDYCSGTAEEELQSVQTLLMDAGIFESPAYLYKGERFHGRAHLPLIRWYLSGQQGPPPV